MINLPYKHTSNNSAWMTCIIFEDYLRALVAKVVSKSRKIVVFTDLSS
jgi:hypothetical protein